MNLFEMLYRIFISHRICYSNMIMSLFVFTQYDWAKGKILLNLNPSLAQEKNFRMLQIFHACDIVRQNSSALKQVRSSIITTLSLYICIYTLP